MVRAILTTLEELMKIWFNRWFTTVSHYMTMIRNNYDQREFIIYGTHPNKDALYLQNCDFAYVEPDISGEAYIDFCLQFCKEHGIEIFIPRKENVLISKNLTKFQQIGVKVLVCEDHDLMELMDNKAAIYHSIMDKQQVEQSLVAIPEFYVVHNIDEFKEAYEKLKSKGLKICFKPVIGEGAQGFRVIKEGNDSIEDLFGGVSARISYTTACEILSQKSSFPPLMVLEYLEGAEYSIDCLAYDGTLSAMIPRKKGSGRVRELENNAELIQIAKSIYENYPLPYVFNIQVKYSNGIPKLLEINPRMSGGLHISCLSGINFPYLAVKLLLGEKIEEIQPQFGIRASYIEKEVILKEVVI